jgi:hypothetical protein
MKTAGAYPIARLKIWNQDLDQNLVSNRVLYAYGGTYVGSQ